MLTINVVTIFPEFFSGPLSLSIPARAAAAGAVRYNVVDLRDFTSDRHRTVDDYAYGGGPGMVMKPEPFFEAVDALRATAPIVLLSARGRQFTHADAVRYSGGAGLTLLCGHYKDVDQRVADHLATEEISLGDFVLSGGEPAALAIVDATVRLLAGAMSDFDSARTDSFFEGRVSAPSYTRPPVYRDLAVPEVLLSGDHRRIAAWRASESERLTRERTAEVRIRPASRADGEGVLTLLQLAGLPPEGVLERLEDDYAVAEDPAGRIVGVAGAESWGDYALLRSVAVAERARGRGIAARLVGNRLQAADRRGARGVFLLTTTAHDYFLRRGFKRVSRDDVPSSIRVSAEFSTLCPSSAVVMVFDPPAIAESAAPG